MAEALDATPSHCQPTYRLIVTRILRKPLALPQ
jgi:hypothetical protein